LKRTSDGHRIGAMEKPAGSVLQDQSGSIGKGLPLCDSFNADNDVSDPTRSLIDNQCLVWDCHATYGVVPVNRQGFGFWDYTSHRDPATDRSAGSSGIYFIRMSSVYCAEHTTCQQE